MTQYEKANKSQLVGKKAKKEQFACLFFFVRSVFLTLGSLEGVELGGLDVVDQSGHLLGGHSLPLRRALRSVHKYIRE